MQVVLITGCGSGLGKALARSFKQAAFAGEPSGFRVFASDLNLDSIKDLRIEGIEVLTLDVTNAESVQRGVSHIEQEAGRLDVLICNAGIVTIAPLIEEELSEIQAVWNVNTCGTASIASLFLQTCKLCLSLALPYCSCISVCMLHSHVIPVHLRQ